MKTVRLIALCAASSLVACAPLRDHAGWAGTRVQTAVAELPGWPEGSRPPAISSFTFANGDRLTGLFRDGKVIGTAQVDYADGKRYVGEFEDNRVHGHGTLLMPNGDRYEGQFVQGRRQGTGVYSFASGGQYRGQFTDDHITGFGHFTYTNGDRYSGQFLDGAHHGLGRLISGSGRATQEGRWKNGVFVWPQRIEQF
jgi:hypothetical protein